MGPAYCVYAGVASEGCRCWPRSGLNGTSALSKLGFRVPEGATRRNSPQALLESPEVSQHRTAEREMGRLIAGVFCGRTHPQKTALETLLAGLLFGLKSHFQLRKYLAVVPGKNKTKTAKKQNTTPNHLCPSLLISADSYTAFGLSRTFLISLINVCCLLSQDLVLTQNGKLGSDCRSRGSGHQD